MSLKAELEAWTAALKAYDDKEFSKSIDLFDRFADTSKIVFNIGIIYATTGDHDLAVEKFSEATSLDHHLAIAYYQCGVSNFLLGRYAMARQDFDETYAHLRGNQYIDYDQLGLKFKLWSAEVLFNRGLSQIYEGNLSMGMRDLEAAQKEKAVDDHDVIDDAIADEGRAYTVFSIPVGILYRPSENKIKNAKAKDYMGKAKLIATSEVRDAFTGFSGVGRMEQGVGPRGQLLEPREMMIATSPVKDNPLAFKDADLPLTPPDSVRSDAAVQLPQGPRRRAGSAEEPLLARSGTISTVRPPVDGIPTRGLTIKRKNTFPNDEGRTREEGPSAAAFQRLRREPSASNGLGRSATQRNASRPPVGRASPVEERDLPTLPRRAQPGGVVTQFLDGYIAGFGNEPNEDAAPEEVEVFEDPRSRVAAWQTRTIPGASPNIPPSRAPSTRAGGARRGPMRAATIRTLPSDSYDDVVDQVRIRVKIHYNDDVRGMAITPETSFEDFADMVTVKFGRSWGELDLKFKDEDGASKISLKDAMDWDLALEQSREVVNGRGKPEARLEIWLTDV